MQGKGYVDKLGKSLSSLTSYDLVALYKKSVSREAEQKMARDYNNKSFLVEIDTHKDIQLLENEFSRRFKALDAYIVAEHERQEMMCEDRRSEVKKWRSN